MVEILSYIVVAIYLIVCEIGISSWVKKADGQPTYESRKRWRKFYRISILSTITLFMIVGAAVCSRLIAIR